MPKDPDAPTQAGPPHRLPREQLEGFERGAIIDRYTVLERLGRGGMGEVYSAYDAKLDRRVALKLLLSRRPDYESRLSREAQAMARLSHPNVVSVFDTGVAAGRLFIAMEFVQGTTLRGWLRAFRRSVPDVLAVYVEAGRGLAAAHDAGLVHRDFKPDNVLVSAQGAVKVTDFGLVRADGDDEMTSATPARLPAGDGGQGSTEPEGDAAETLPAHPSFTPSASGSVSSARTSGPLETPMTEEGALLGTVGYMAPEQYLSQPVNAKTDQFAFSVALYDALYGQKPFEGRGVAELAAATVTGSVREPPKGSGVPAHVHRVLLRGLSAERDARYPSMHALLEDLQRDPAKERRRILGGVFGATLVVATVVFGVRAATARQGKLCSAATPLASEVWNDDVKSSIERSFAATGLPFAVDTWSRTRDQLDGYMTQWRRMHEDTCRATRIDGHQSEATMAIRMGCLEQRRDQVRALSHVLEQADRQTVERSVEAAKNLPNIEACADVTSLTTVKALPADGEKRKAIQDLYREVGDLRVRGDAGRYKDVTAAAPGVIERARATGYDPLVAEALYVLGDAQDHLGAKPDSATSLREAYYAAEAGRAEELKLKSLILLVSVLADQRKFEEARATSRLAAAASQRLPDPSAYDADLHSANAWVLCRDGKYDESAAEFQKGIAAAERASDAKPVKLARMYSRAGGMLGDGGRFDQAYDLLDRADATFIRVLGPDHPARATTAVNRTATLLDQGRATEALATVEAGLELGTRVLPQQSGTLANLENNRSVALHSLGRFEEARSAAAHAVEIGKSVAGPTSVTTAGYLITLGEALVGLGRWDEANATLDGVLAVIEPALPAGHEWLAEARAARAEARMGRGDAKGALPDLEKALVGYHGIDHKTFFARRNEAQVEAALAEALWGTGVRSPRVGDLVSAALTTFGDLHDEPRARALDTWARTHIAAGPGVSGRSR